MRYVFDLDGTICEEMPTFERFLANPKQAVVDKINTLYENGHTIIIFTARSWAEYDITKQWLEKYCISYDLLMCGKVIYDVWVDDRALNVTDIERLK